MASLLVVVFYGSWYNYSNEDWGKGNFLFTALHHISEQNGWFYSHLD
jgi:hypothetical protein